MLIDFLVGAAISHPAVRCFLFAGIQCEFAAASRTGTYRMIYPYAAAGKGFHPSLNPYAVAVFIKGGLQALPYGQTHCPAQEGLGSAALFVCRIFSV